MSASSDGKKVLLLVEDDPGLQSQIKWCFEDYEVVVAENRESALAQLRRREPPLVLLDLGLPPDPANASEGFVALEQILKLQPATKVVVVTGNDERANAVKAVGMGAYDFYEKPVDPAVLGLIVDRAYRVYELEQENRRLAQRDELSPLEGIVAASPRMMRVCDTVEKVAPADASVLLLGESGTGKELLARALHNLSARRGGRFAVINCAAIPETLLESELFGYEKGAFTGATRQTVGKIERADGGTLFLDEVGDLSQALQAKILRFLQERVVERLGGRTEIPVDVRVVCATHQDLDRKMVAGDFREDLYYRIAEVTVAIPPLRDRGGDAVLLARAFLDRHGRAQGRTFRGFSDEAMRAIESCAWHGNVRELENRVKRAVIMANGPVIEREDLDLPPQGEATPMPLNLREVRESAERRTIRQALMRCDNRVTHAAELLGVSRPTLYNLMQKYGFKQ